MQQLTLCLELSRLAPSQFNDFAFTGLARWGDKVLAAGPDGIYEIESGDSDDGAPIATRWDLPVTDFGTAHQKRLRRVYASGEFRAVTVEGSVHDSITLYLLDDEGNERAFPIEPEDTDGKQTGAIARISRDGKGRSWQLRVESDGADYSIDSFSAAVISLTRKPSGV